MNKFIASALLSILLGGIVFAQGTINFANLSVGLDAPVYLSDGTTRLSGPQYMAEVLAGPTANSLAPIATTPFLTGAAAGYFNGRSQSIPTVAGGSTAFVQIDVWNTAAGATFAEAQASGLGNAFAQSTVFTVTTGNPINDGGGPTPPATLSGLTPMNLNAPAPIRLQFSLIGGELILSWSDRAFALQQATNAAGVYSNIVDAVSPYTNQVAGSPKFFRLRTN